MNLIEAIKTNNEAEFTKFLNNLKSGIYDKKIIDETDEKCGGTALYWASAYGHLHFISPLLEAGATIDKPDNKGRTPVFIAAEMGHAEVITALHAKGAAVETLDIYDRAPIWMAAAEGHAKVITALKAAGASMDTQTNDGTTPVYVAATIGHAEAVLALKTAGANIHTPNNLGETPVYGAAMHEHVWAISALVMSGANVNTPALNGETPLSVAIEMSTTSLFGKNALDSINALLQAGADPSMTTPKGTPLELAQKIEDPKGRLIVKLLEEHLKRNLTLKNIPCVTQHTDVKQEQKSIRKEDLEKLRLIFLEEREEGEKIEKYDLYNAFFKESHLNAALVYKHKQKTNVFYLNGKPLKDNDLVAGEISKMIDALTLENPVQAAQNPVKFRAEEKFSETKDSTELLQVTTSQVSGNYTPLMFSPSSPKTPIHAVSSIVPIVDSKDDIKTFLTLIVEGEQDKAEAMLKRNPNLALESGDVTDLSGRTFTAITGFQYAVWALDWHMWTMIKKYLPPENAELQAQGFETGSWIKTHGVHFDVNIIIEAYKMAMAAFDKKPSGVFKEIPKQAWKEYEENTRKAWIEYVGGAQRLLPAHMVNEYCHPTRPFFSSTYDEPYRSFQASFKETTLPRNRMGDEGEWFSAIINGGKLGETFAWHRGKRENGASGKVEKAYGDCAWAQDGGYVRYLINIRTAQRSELIAEFRIIPKKMNI